MLVFSVAVLTLVVTAVVGQDTDCTCTSFYLCTGTVITTGTQCDGYDEVCCVTATNTEIDPVTVTEPSTTTEEELATSTVSARIVDGGICGKRGENGPSPDWKITGDDVDTAFGEFPWMVAVLKTNQTGGVDFLCGGSIIYPNIILTTAHNVRGYTERDLVVKAGVWDTMDAEEVSKHQDRHVSRIVMHPGFSKGRIIANDIAILVLSEPLTLTDNVATVCLPSSDVQLNTSACVATGWGTDKFGKNSTSPVLKRVDLPLVDFDLCQDELRKVRKLGGTRFQLHNSFMCAGGDKVDTCKGDGGGPLMCPSLNEPHHYTQVGVTSWGIDCGNGTPGVYASVQAAASWIQETASEPPFDLRSNTVVIKA